MWLTGQWWQFIIYNYTLKKSTYYYVALSFLSSLLSCLKCEEAPDNRQRAILPACKCDALYMPAVKGLNHGQFVGLQGCGLSSSFGSS